MTAYVITKGTYSDYRICAVTLDPQKAERLKMIYDACSYDEADIEEYEIDAHSERLLNGDRLYRVMFDTRGNVTGVKDITAYENRENIYRCGVQLTVEVFAKSEDGAIKIAAERRAKYLAEKEGIA